LHVNDLSSGHPAGSIALLDGCTQPSGCDVAPQSCNFSRWLFAEKLDGWHGFSSRRLFQESQYLRRSACFCRHRQEVKVCHLLA